MAKLDRIREEIGWLKLVFGVLVAIDASLIAWIAHNYATAEQSLLAMALLGACSLSGAILWINRRAYRRIEELEDL